MQQRPVAAGTKFVHPTGWTEPLRFIAVTIVRMVSLYLSAY
jgi:hypothetical protein